MRRSGLDRRSGIDRRTAYDLNYFEGKSINKRKTERRQFSEKRGGWVRITKWSSLEMGEKGS